MAVIIKTKKEIEILRAGGKRLSEILHAVAARVAPGVSTRELDQYAQELIRKGGDEPAFLNYKPDGAATPFPAALCVSTNNEVVHGLPTDRILKEGDIVSIDLGLKHKGMFTDMAMTVSVGKISKRDADLLRDGRDALLAGIAEAEAGKRTGDIGHAIEKFVNKRYGIVRDLSGHGVGREIHEDPYVPNFGKKGTGHMLEPGMVIAIEPMLNLGTGDVVLDRDQWTIKTADGKRSAHFEHTVLITENGPEILTEHR